MKKCKGIECWRLVPREQEEERGRLGEGPVGKVPLSCASGAGASVLGFLVPSACSSNATCCSSPSVMFALSGFLKNDPQSNRLPPAPALPQGHIRLHVWGKPH